MPKELKIDDINDLNGLIELEDISLLEIYDAKPDIKFVTKQDTREESKQEIKMETKEEIKQDIKLETREEIKQDTKQETNTVVALAINPSKEKKVINGWTKENQTHFNFCLHRLKYYRVINNFFFFELKKREGQLSWAIIVLSSFSSVLSLINTNNNIFPNSIEIVKWSLVLLTLITTLIGSYIKKQQFIDRINNIDRYLQQLNQTIEELNITFILEPMKRESYDDFCKNYIPIIKNLSVSPASFSPTEWKHTVYMITKYYPELIEGDGTNEELLWPWFHINVIKDNKRVKTEFGKTVIKSFQHLDI